MKLREWQVECLDAFVEQRNKGRKNTFVFEACPGAGKSTMAAELSWQMCNDDEKPIDLVIVVVPWKSIQGDESNGMIAAFDRRGLIVRDRLMLRGARIVQQPAPTNFDAIVTTYAEAMTVEGIETIEMWAKKGLRIALVFDEIHHASEQKGEWGGLCETAHESSQMTIVMSGTYFRTDQRKIKFVDYGEDMKPLTDCPPYKYAQAVADRVCRPVAFKYYDADMKCIDEKSGVETHSLSSISDTDRRFGKVMKEAFHPEGDIVRHMIQGIDEHLTRTRRRFPDAAALITCRPGRSDFSEDKHVKQIAQKVRQYTGKEVTVVTHNDRNAQGKIDQFRNGTSPYLVAVNMISEGVDIPRLRAVGFMRYIKSEMMFRQIVGRTIRMTNDEDENGSIGFMPKFDLMYQFAKNMENEALTGIRDWECEECGKYPCECVCKNCGNEPCTCTGGGGPEGPAPTGFDVIETNVADAGGSVSDDDVSESFITIAKAIAQRSPHHMHSNLVHLAHALEMAYPMAGKTEESESPNSPMQKLKLARSRVNRLISKLTGKLYDGDFQACWFNELMKPTGSDWQTIKNTWNLQQLEGLGNRLEERLVQAYKNGGAK